jgi:two-component system response regulator FixJ
VITGQAQVRLAVEAMKSGAADFLEKPFAPEDLLQAIRRAGRPAGARAASAPPADVFASLSAREREVLADVLSGATNKVIARRLQISPRTVEVYRASVMRKVGAASLSDLVRRALMSGFPVVERPPAIRRGGPDAVDGCLQ